MWAGVYPASGIAGASLMMSNCGKFTAACCALAVNTTSATTSVSSPSVPEAVAAVFGDRYELEGQLGQGGFGTVVKALDRRLNRCVAMKVTHSRSADPEQLLREARSLAHLPTPSEAVRVAALV